MIKLSKSLPVGNTGMAVKVLYELPLQVRCSYATCCRMRRTLQNEYLMILI